MNEIAGNSLADQLGVRPEGEKVSASGASRSKWSGLAQCAAVALLALAMSLACWRSVRPVDVDSLHYLRGANSLLQGRYLDIQDRPQTVFPPGYPALIALGMVMGGEPELVGRLISLAGATAALPLVLVVLRRLGSNLLALSAAILFALLPERVQLSTSVLSDAPSARIIVSSRPHVAYHAGLSYRQLPAGTFEQVLASARRENADLLMLPKDSQHPSLCAHALAPTPIQGLRPLVDWDDALLLRVEPVGSGPPGEKPQDHADWMQ